MTSKILKANALLFLAALVWGCTFVAQRVGMEHWGPLGFTGVRFALGAAVLLPLAWWRRDVPPPDFLWAARRPWRPFLGAALAGLAMFGGINLQQIGLVETTAGKAGFITGLYVVIVPLMGLLWGRRPGLGVWIGATMGAVGLYLLSVTAGFTLAPGDGWILLCAFIWAAHVWIVGWLSPKIDSFFLACGQAAVCSILSLIGAGLSGESFSSAAFRLGWIPIVWGGLMSVALGFTLQVMGQKNSPPAHAAIILALESVVAALAGWAILGESLGPRGIIGSALMLAGTLVAQLWALREERAAVETR